MIRRPGASRRRALTGQRFGTRSATLVTLLFVTVVGQRLALPLPGFQLQLTLLASLVALGVLLLHDQLRPDRVRLQLYAAAALLCTLTTFFAGYMLGGPASLPSWLVLLALYAPWIYRLDATTVEEYRRFASVFVGLMLMIAATAVAQFASQVLGVWRYSDPLADALPRDLLIQGYNVSIPLSYGASLHKSNAFVFLEPSFLSQFCALAIIVAVLLRAPVWQLVLLGLGLLSAVSGTGLLLLVVGAVLAVVRTPALLRPRLVATAAAGAVAFLWSPYAPLLLERRKEFGQQGSSGYDRFVAPYLEVARGLAEEPIRYLLGAGPGTATRLLESSARGQLGDAIVYNIPTKLVFEYGLVAGVLFTVFIVVGVVHRAPMPVVPGVVLVMLFLLSGSLLQPHTVVLAWLLTGMWTGTRNRAEAPANAGARPPDGPAPPATARRSVEQHA